MPRAPKQIASNALAPPNLFCGTSGWDYPTWKPGFYPTDLPRRAFLDHYAANFTSVEVNYTFRSELKTDTAATWLAATPADFLFSVKAPQRITHFSRLRDCDTHLENFLATLAPLRTANRLGAILFQLPPNFKSNTELLRTFLTSKLFRKNAPRIAFEFRHDSWFTAETYSTLSECNAALCVADTDSLITPEVHPANFTYFRLRHPGGYKPRQLGLFAEKFVALAATKPTFAYFMHEEEPTGALNARVTLTTANKLSGTRA